MRKKIFVSSAILCLYTSTYANNISNKEMMEQIKILKAQIAALESKIGATQVATKKNKVSLEKMIKNTSKPINDSRFTKLEQKVERVAKTAQKAKAQSAGDNLKWTVDFRTAVDNIQYKHADGSKSKNSSLMTNRLLLGMKYAADDNSIFYGTLAYHKAFGDSANHQQANTNPGYANFDWITSENALDGDLRVKEAYWLYKNNTLLGTNIPWTASIGRRPSTDGLGINLRADQPRKSPLSHTINVEFDGASARFDLESLTGVEGMWLKFCAGRGLTNAKPRFSSDGTDYSEDKTLNPDVDMAGFIFVPWDNGQYSIHANYARAWNMIGWDNSDIAAMQDGNPATNPSFNDVGDIDFATIMFKADGIGEEISDYLDETQFFASYAMSRTMPSGDERMIGSNDKQTGHSFWLGINAPCPIMPEEARIGIEWNKGSKYWRSMTYGEDTMAGSKIAARGTAWEVYRHQKLTKALSFGLSYTYIDYDYTGSNAFFGVEGTPNKIGSTQANAQNAVESAQDIKAYMRYRF